MGVLAIAGSLTPGTEDVVVFVWKLWGEIWEFRGKCEQKWIVPSQPTQICTGFFSKGFGSVDTFSNTVLAPENWEMSKLSSGFSMSSYVTTSLFSK